VFRLQTKGWRKGDFLCAQALFFLFQFSGTAAAALLVRRDDAGVCNSRHFTNVISDLEGSSFGNGAVRSAPRIDVN